MTTQFAEPEKFLIDEAGEKMYWTDDATGVIQRASLDGTEIEDLVVSGSDLKALAMGNGKIYWALPRAIQRSNVDGTETEEIVSNPGFVTSMALDPESSKLYWTLNSGKIQRANPDGTESEDVITDIKGPTSLVLDLQNSLMYWGVSGAIQRASLSGGTVEDIVTDVSLPRGVALDTDGGKIYWTDSNNEKVQRANLDGTEIEDLAVDLRTPAGIALGPVMSTTAIHDEEPIPQLFSLEPNYPNPFNPQTVIRYSLTQAAQVKLHVYDQLGRMVATPVNRQQAAGTYNVSWKGRDQNGLRVASGVYLYRMVAGDFVKTRSMLLVK